MQELSTVWFAWDWTDYLFELIVFPIALITLLIGVGLIKSEEKETGFGCLFAAFVVSVLPMVQRFVEHYHGKSDKITGAFVTVGLWVAVWLISLVIFGAVLLGIMKLKEGELGCGIVCLLLVVVSVVICIVVFSAHNQIWDLIQDFVNVSSTISIIFIVIIIYIFITLF